MFQVRRAKLIFPVEKLDNTGRLEAVQEVPVDLMEVNFDMTIGSLVERLLAQLDGQAEAPAVEGEQKEE